MNPAENWHTVTEPPAAPAALPNPAAIVPPPIGRKNPILAALLSAFPGIGNVYNGLYMRGVTFFLIIMSLIAIADRQEIFVPVVAFFWVFSVIDSYRQATLINYGYAQDLGLVDLPRHPRASQGGLFAGVLLSLIGIIAALDRYTVIRLDWIVNLWPFVLIMVGAWMIWASLRDRRREEG